MAKSVKMKDIATALGVSVMTVSNALTGKAGVSDALRVRVYEKAEELGYDLSRYQRKESIVNIGILSPGRYLGSDNSFYQALYQNVMMTAAKRHFITTLEILPVLAEQWPRMPKIVADAEIQGLIVIGWMEREYLQRVIQEAGVPVVLLDFYDDRFQCDAVMSNNYYGMYRSTRLLVERGHRKIAFVGSVQENDNILDRFYGYRRALEEAGIPLRQEWILEDREPSTGKLQLRLPEEMPTAFACNCDLTAGYLYDRLRERGYRVPEDISVTGYDDFLFGSAFARELSTYHVNIEGMAKKAVSILQKKIRGGEKYRGVFYVDGYLKERSSVQELHS